MLIRDKFGLIQLPVFPVFPKPVSWKGLFFATSCSKTALIQYLDIKVIFLKGLHTRGVKFQMLFLICLSFIFSSYFIKNTSGMNPFNENKDPDLPPDFVRKWEDSQVFIYYKTKFTQKFSSEYPYPDCFGNLITAEYVITSTSCFMDLKKLIPTLTKSHSLQDLWLKTQILNSLIPSSSIGKIIIAKVCWYY